MAFRDTGSSLHKADAAFTKQGATNVGAEKASTFKHNTLEFVSGGQVHSAVQGGGEKASVGGPGNLEFVSGGQVHSTLVGGRKEPLAACAPPEDDAQDPGMKPLFCKACRKVLSTAAMFNHHKTGKKHRKALKARGMEEDDVPDVVEPPPPEQDDGGKIRKAPEPSSAPAAAMPADGEAAEDRPPPKKPRPGGPAKPLNPEWWKGTVHAKGKDGSSTAPSGTATGTGEWLCVSMRCSGAKNPRTATHCKVCGALRRLGTQAIRTDERDTVNDYARRR